MRNTKIPDFIRDFLYPRADIRHEEEADKKKHRAPA